MRIWHNLDMAIIKKVVKGTIATTAAVSLLNFGRKNHLRASVPISPQTNGHALVLGSGGMLGAAWMASSLNYLESNKIWKPEDDDLRIGTSAGSLLAALLGGGVTSSDLIEILAKGYHKKEDFIITLPNSPSRDKIPISPSDPTYLFRSILKGRSPHLGIIVSSLFPEGEEPNFQIEDFVNKIVSNEWSSTPTWVIATEVKSGLRKIFNNQSDVSLGRAVAASCAVPALYAPVLIKSKKYIDGGTISCHNLDVAVRSGAKSITLLTPISGYTKISLNSGVSRALNQFTRNTEQFSMNQIVRKLPSDIKLRIVSPGKESRKILSKYSLMDTEKLASLLDVASNEIPEITEIS